jgi:hypothetical protein
MTREEQAALVAWLRGPGVVWSAVTEQLEEFGSVQTAAAEQAPAQGSLFEAARTDGGHRSMADDDPRRLTERRSPPDRDG